VARFVPAATALLLVVAGGEVYYAYNKTGPAPQVATAPVTRGDIVEVVAATGTLQAVTTVEVGTQVSGTISELHADFNSLVRKGEVLARLEPSLFQTEVEQARANLARAQADVENQRVGLNDAKVKLARAEELFGLQLLARQDLDSAQTAASSAEAQFRSSEAQVKQAQASLSQSQVNLEHTVITSPIDGIVVSRNVDVGQTVAASIQAPTLFVLAADLTKMQVVASVDEADVGRIRPGQTARFRVDAYPDQAFTGTVTQVRLQPQVQQNVVTYSTVIDVPNPGLELKPGMTATVDVEIARRGSVLRIPSAALRFRPSADTYTALGQKPPESGGSAGSSNSAQRTGGASGGRGPAVFADRQANGRGLTPPASVGRAPEPGAQAPTPSVQERLQPLTERNPKATNVDSLFGPLPPQETAGRVWLFVSGQLKPVRVRWGISDGKNAELLEGGGLEPGTELVTGVNTGQSVRPPASAFGSPFAGAPRGLQGGPGGFAPGGRLGGR
jgi:HlyD family secretion protein